MDTSIATTMSGIQSRLKPHLDHLPFRRLREEMSEFKKDIEGVTYTFRYYTTMAPLDMLFLEDRVFAIPIKETFRTAGTKKTLKQFDLLRLLLKKSPDGGMHAVWYLHRAQFVPAHLSKTYFDSSQSSIRYVGPQYWLEKLCRQDNLPANLDQVINTAIGKWIGGTIDDRKTTLARLEELKRAFLPE